MNSLKEKLQDLGLKRNEPVGKTMGSDIYFHKQYISDFIDDNFYRALQSHIPDGFNFDIIKYNEKDKKISFISCPNFNNDEEPEVGNSFTVDFSKKMAQVYETSSSQNNPLIYHHKWMFVKDSFEGFNSTQSKLRSIEWKSKLESNKKNNIDDKNISSRIGRKSFWTEWCEANDISVIFSGLPQPFKFYSDIEEYKTLQGESSKDTSLNQIPSIVRFIKDKTNINLSNQIILDIGCGRFIDGVKNEFEKLGCTYYGCDPYNQTPEHNKESILNAANGKSSIVTLNNVLNTISYHDSYHILENIMEQAQNALTKNGLLMITIYEGEPTAKEKKKFKETGVRESLSPIKTSKGFQNRMNTEEYMDLVTSYFPKAIRKGKVIVATKNPNLNLSKVLDKKRRVGQKR